jgi:O-antigen ligase
VSEFGSPVLVVPNDIALVAVIAPFSVSLLFGRPNRLLSLLAVMSIAASMSAVIVLQSRGALLSIIVTTALTVGLIRPRLGLLTCGLVVIVALVIDAILGFPLIGKFGWFPGARLSLWLAAWTMFLDAPLLGHGPHTYVLSYRSYIEALQLSVQLPVDPRVTPWPHNLYLEVLAERGVIGIAAFGALLGIGLRRGWLIRQRVRGEARRYVSGALTGLLGLCIVGLYEASLLRLWVTVLLFSTLGVLACFCRLLPRLQQT